jgi:hypothetical protein
MESKPKGKRGGRRPGAGRPKISKAAGLRRVCAVSMSAWAWELCDGIAAAYGGIGRGRAIERCLRAVGSKWIARSIRRKLGRIPKWAVSPPPETKGDT